MDRERAHRLDDSIAGRSGQAGRRVCGSSLLDRQQAFGYTQEGHQVPARADGHQPARPSARWATTRRWPCCPDKNKTAVQLLQAAVRPGDEPADRPDPRGHRDEPEQLHRPRPNLLDINAVNPPMRLEVTQPVLDFDDMARLRDIERHTSGKFKPQLDITYPRWPGAPRASRPNWPRCAPRAVDAIGRHNILIITDRAMGRPRRHSGAAGAVGHHHHLVRGACAPRRPGGRDRLGARGASLRRAGRLRRRGRCTPYLAMETLVANCTPGCQRTGRRRGDLQLRQGHRQGPVEDHVQDGRVHLHVVLRRADVRGHRPGKPLVDKYFRGTASQVGGIGVSRWPKRSIPAHAHRPPSAPTRCCRAMLDAGGEYAWRTRRRTHVDADAIAKLQHSARNKFDTYKEYAQIINDQSKRHGADAARPVRVQRSIRPRPSRWTRSSRPKIVKRFATGAMSPGLDPPGALDAGHRDEPHRRQEQHRRGRRGSGARYRNELKGIPIARAPRCPTSSAPRSSRPTTR